MIHSCLFEREVYIFGVRRSGIHAIQNWVIEKFDNRKECICQNNTKFLLCTDGFYKNVINHDDHSCEISNDIKYKLYLNVVEQEPLKFIVPRMQNPKSAINFQKKRVCFEMKREVFSGRFDFILILRNPFNNLASIFELIKRNAHKADKTYHIERGMLSTFKERWIQYAKEYLGETSYLPNKLCILYDRWFRSEKYRLKLSNQLNMSEKDCHKKLSHGRWASSFDGRKYKNKAHKMDVLNRWKSYKDNEEYNAILADKELRDLYIKIWKKFPY